jgi:hypothetical protein
MAIMELFGKREKPKIIRAQRSPYMNLAYGILPTCPAAWGTPPAPLANLTDEKKSTHLDTDGVAAAGVAKSILIDLGQVYEVYEIVVTNRAGEGIKAAHDDSTGTAILYADTAATPVTQRGATQTPAGTAFEDIDASKVGYNGEGIAVRYVMVTLDPDASYSMTLDINEIQVFGC